MSALARLFRRRSTEPRPLKSVSTNSADGNGPNRRKKIQRTSRDVLWSRDQLIQTLDANAKTRDYKWRGAPNQAGIAYRMYTDPVVQNASNIRVHPLISNQAIWRVQPPVEATDYEREASRFCEWMLTSCISWPGLLRFVGKHRHQIGVANVEFTDEVQPVSRDAFPLHPTGTAIVLSDFLPIPPWSIKEYLPGEGQQASGFIQHVMGGGERVIDMNRDLILRFTMGQEGKNYFGIPTARAAYGDWSQKTLMQVVRVLKHERFGLGTPIGKEPEKTNDADRQLVAEYLENLRMNESGFALLPHGWELDILIPHIEHGTNLSADIEACNIAIYSAYTNSVASLGTGKFGSNALADTQDNHLDNGIEADAADIASVITHGVDGWSIIKRYTALNYPGARIGKLVGSNFSQSANYKYMEMVEKLIKSGAIRPFEELETYLLDKLVAPLPSLPWSERLETIRRQEITSVTDDDEDSSEETSNGGGEE